jgi:hypothetical protein
VGDEPSGEEQIIGDEPSGEEQMIGYYGLHPCGWGNRVIITPPSINDTPIVSAAYPHAQDVMASFNSPHHGIPFSGAKVGSSDLICTTRSWRPPGTSQNSKPGGVGFPL